jgi:hypothetical protein
MELAQTIATFVALSIGYNLLRRYYVWRSSKAYTIPDTKYRRGEEIEPIEG